jgi:hypothetical protein
MKKILATTLLVMAFGATFAQQYHWRLTYDMSQPLGEFNTDYISNYSWRGMGIDNRWMLTDKISAGAYFAWHVFYERIPNITQTSDNGNGNITATGTQFRYVNSYVMQANVHYYLGSDGETNPWIGLGVGTAYNEQRTDLGFLSYSYDPWSFALSPQIGLDIPIAIGTDFMIGVRYNYWMNGEDKATSDFTYLGINVGFKFTPF